MDDSNLMLNLTTGGSKKSRNHDFQNVSGPSTSTHSDSTPLVNFVSKPRVTSSTGEASRRPTFKVLRKKATPTDKEAKKKTLGEVSFQVSQNKPEETRESQPTTSYERPAKKKDVAKKRGSKGAQKSRPAARTTNSKWLVTNKEEKPLGVQGAAVISSLFRKNPEIPVVDKTTVESTKENVFSSRSFSELQIHPHLVATLEKDLHLEKMTEAQYSSIPLLLKRKDVLVKSQTGSGKTLAYGIPIVQTLQQISPKIDRTSGILALVIVPTRELVLQTYTWFVKILKPFTWVVASYLMGGEKKKSEKARIRKGVNILVSTPGRLLDHLSSTKNLNLGRLQWLVLDEADRLLDLGYEKDVAKILGLVSEHFEKEGGIGQRQTVMLSATLSAGVEKLAGLTLNSPELVNMNDEEGTESSGAQQKQLVIPTTLKQSYIIVPAKLRLVSLAAFILWKSTISTEKKMLIFMTTQDMVDYHHELFNLVLGKKEDEKVNFYKLHGSMAQKDRMSIFKEFRDAQNGVLLCTDVAARGLDLPRLDWIVQYNPPVTAEDYVHRVGRTARVGQCGQALLFLAPAEVDFVSRLTGRGINLTATSPDPILKSLTKTCSKMARSMEEAATGLQLSFEECVDQSYNLYQTATKGYVSFVRSYATFPKDVRDVFDFTKLHLGHYAKSFALRDPPTQINSRGRGGQRNDKTKKFNTAAERNPKSALKRTASAAGHDGPSQVRQQPTFRERREMLSEFASGLDAPAAKRRK